MPLYKELADDQILQSWISGDDQAFAEIYNRYWKRLVALAYTHTKDKFLAEEITQEVFLSLLNRKDSLKILTLSAYLNSAVKFAIYKYIYSRNRRIEIFNAVTKNAKGELPDEIVHAKFLNEYLNDVINKLPEKCRMAYGYSREMGLSTKQIAELMGISERTVEYHILKALNTLKIHLKEFLMIVTIVKFLSNIK
ncbi:RNA polymerase sigma factor [Mucilaginibacter paludis]|uniref:RNA polymerase, sigma-24 subunit, ECF subfamily n=1 Tax=Mucilaginibacter paludis DSM 18603 TaxID=714943 RepID=H1Y4F0_9SPHI|nr:sigma-70 family RNA polymerase sigma factor [Mucilaginibacter paludis]EHQ25784.1 RNA polymerase, sigma-24 subunit, ECF subfamily [Mucilaginibacter paludis DSM 18603]